RVACHGSAKHDPADGGNRKARECTIERDPDIDEEIAAERVITDAFGHRAQCRQHKWRNGATSSKNFPSREQCDDRRETGTAPGKTPHVAHHSRHRSTRATTDW